MNRTSSIYVWLCPDTGLPIYVGKSSSPNSRMASHRRLALKGHQSPKYVWLRKCLAGGKRPRVVILERAPIERSGAIERRWVRRFRRRFELANLAAAGAGNPGIGRVLWTPEIDALLGSVPDATLAARLGCERKTVSYRRECLGIKASFDRTNNTPPPNMAGWNRRSFGDDIIAKLGTVPDYVLAKLAGSNKKTIARERKQRGIPSYAATSGNDGRIKVGDPHPRWTQKRRFPLSPDPRLASSARPLT